MLNYRCCIDPTLCPFLSTMSYLVLPRILQKSGAWCPGCFKRSPVKLLNSLVWHWSLLSALSAKVLNKGLPGPKPKIQLRSQPVAQPPNAKSVANESISLYFRIASPLYSKAWTSRIGSVGSIDFIVSIYILRFRI